MKRLGRRLPLLIVAALLAFASLVGSAVAARLYMPGYYSAEPEVIAGFETAADGSMEPLTGSPFVAYEGSSPYPVGGMANLAFGPEGLHAAAGFSFKGGVQGYSVTDGAISPAGAPQQSLTTTSIAVSPDGRFAYASTAFGHSASGIHIYAIEADGSLTPEGSAGEFEGWDLALTPDGKFAFAQTTKQTIERFKVEADGSLEPLGATSLGHSAINLQVSPDGRFLFVAEEGSSSDGVASFTIGADGSLTENGTPALTGGAALRDFAVSPDGRHIYMPDSNVPAIVVANVATDGSLSVTDPPLEVEYPESVAVSPDGRFLYFSTNVEIGVASIGADGSLTLLPYKATAKSGETERLVFQPQPTPQASFTATAGAAGSATTFDATASARAARFDWEFGDGTTLADGGPTPTHVYSAPGVYTATLTVTDADGCSISQVYTGQSTVCPGGSAATMSATVTVASSETEESSGGGSETTGGGNGTTGGGSTTNPPTGGQGPTTTAPPAKPAITHLKATPRKFRVAARNRAHGRKHKVGTVFHYRLSTAGKVRFTIERRRPGRRVGKSCRKRSKSNAKHRRCVRFVKLGTRAISGKVGANRFRFAGRLHRKALSPGAYRVTVVVTDSAGRRSKVAHADFKIIG